MRFRSSLGTRRSTFLQRQAAQIIVSVCIAMTLTRAIVADDAARSDANQKPTAIFLTADGEGHVGPCANCPVGVGDGGLARRATMLGQLRKEAPGLLVDAGNAFFGGDSSSSQGKVIAAAYDAMAYDAVNISYRDFRDGLEHTLVLMKQTKFVALSANLLDDKGGRLLFKPYIVKDLGGSKTAMIGVTESPIGLEFLPHLKSQLTGVRIRPVSEALAEWIPKAKAEANQIVLIYYGSTSGLRSIQKQFGNDLRAICVGGIRPSQVQANSKPLVIAAELHGKSVARAMLDNKPIAAIQLAVSPDIASDTAIEQLVERYSATATIAITSTAALPSTTAPNRNPVEPVNVPTTQSVVSSTKPASTVELTAPTSQKLVATSLPTVTPPTIKTDAAKRVAAKQPHVPKGLAGVGLTGEQVDAAIAKGRDFLWGYLQSQHAKYKTKSLVDGGPDLLSVLALVHTGAHQKIPDFDAQLRAYLTAFDPRSTQLSTYESSLFCLLVEAYGDPVFLPKLRDTARYLVELQGSAGTWAYGYSIPQTIYGPVGVGDGKALHVFGGTSLEGATPGIDVLLRVTDYGKDHDGDNSVSQFSLLGLQAASRWHVMAGPEIWKRNLATFRARQCDDGAWDYVDKRPTGYGSMTCAGICALAINRYELGEKYPVVDEQIERGIAWLDRNFSVSANPGNGTSYLYYYLYSLERVGRILDTEFIGTHEWYPQGAKFLVSAQKPTGKWVELTDDEDPRLATSFALLFLTRATATLTPEIARNGSGELRTNLSTAPPARLYIILDASGSMLDEMDGQLKFDVARDAVTAMVGLLPMRSQVALRVYGHRKRSIEPGADEDTEMLIPMGDYNPAKFAVTLKSVQARGKTPMALSLAQAANDIGSSNELTTVVLLTDGGEDTMPRRDPIRAAADFGKLSNLRFHIIGFDVNEQDWKAQLQAMAAASGAQYWPAPKSKDLNRAMRAALLGDPDYFVVLDTTGKEVQRGKFGETKRLPEGKYELLTPFGGKEFRQSFWINTNAITAVGFDSVQAAHDPAAKAVELLTDTAKDTMEKPAAPVTSIFKRFCTNCGKQLSPVAKFCTECGAKVQ